jgi:hypothetical protein
MLERVRSYFTEVGASDSLFEAINGRVSTSVRYLSASEIAE